VPGGLDEEGVGGEVRPGAQRQQRGDPPALPARGEDDPHESGDGRPAERVDAEPANGDSYPVLWPLTVYHPPTPGLYLSTDVWPAFATGTAALAAWLLVRRSTALAGDD
jgi:hypothetical protein